MGIMKWLGLDLGCEREPVALTDENFRDEVLKSEIPVIVDAWSDGCAPCTALAPTIKRLACKFEGQVKVCHLNVGSAPKTAGRLGVRGTPTVLFFKNQAVKERVVGIRGQQFYEEILANDFGIHSAEEAHA